MPKLRASLLGGLCAGPHSRLMASLGVGRFGKDVLVVFDLSAARY